MAKKIDLLQSDEYGFFERKVEMIVEELEAYSEVHYCFEKLENNYEENFRKFTELRAELDKVTNSPQESYGFFKKVSKQDKIKELQNQISHVDITVEFKGRLLGLVIDQMLEVQIPLIKQRKRDRFDYIVKEFSKNKIQQLERELAFWNHMANNEHTIGNSEALDSKLITGQTRITKLPDVQIKE